MVSKRIPNSTDRQVKEFNIVVCLMFLIHFYRLVFKKVSKLMGGRVRIMMSGGAPLSPDTHEQIKTCLCVDLIQGYGLTETTSGATVMDCKYTCFFYYQLCI